MQPSYWMPEISLNDAHELGKSLRQVTKQLKPGRVWYYGNEPYFDVQFDLDGTNGDGAQGNGSAVNGANISWFQFTLRGRSLTWSRTSNTIHTGYTNELDIVALDYPSSKTIQDELSANQHFINLVKVVLESRPQETIFQAMLDLLEQAAIG